MPSERIRWNARHRDRPVPTEPVRLLTERAHLLPRRGRALDVAGGTGRNAIWLAGRGLDVTLVDVSDVALAHAAAAAAEAGVALTTVQADLAADPLPAGPFEVVLVHHYLDREVWSVLPSMLAPGGLLLACQPTIRNLERHARPSACWLLGENEIGFLAEAVVDADPGLEAVEVTEGWTGEGRHEARLVLRRRR
jgi:tellurite methyltransferase